MISNYNLINSPVRSIKARAEHYSSSALAHTFTSEDKIKEVTLERVGDTTKFFGFGVCQKANIKLLDVNRELKFSTSDYFKIAFDNVESSKEQIKNGNQTVNTTNKYYPDVTYYTNNSSEGLIPGNKYKIIIDGIINSSYVAGFAVVVGGRVNLGIVPVTPGVRGVYSCELTMPDYKEGYTPSDNPKNSYITLKHSTANYSYVNTSSTIYSVSIMSLGRDYLNTSPNMHVSEVNRDENTNELSITTYDKIYKASNHTYSELELGTSFTIADVATKIAELLGINGISYPTEAATEFGLTYTAATANFEEQTLLREILDDIAEATQTIYYLNTEDTLVFKRISSADEPVLTIGKQDYLTLQSKSNRRLTVVCSASELGDNVSQSTGKTGTTQYIRDNGFWSLRDDVATLVQNALAIVGNLTINQFDCSWRGNQLLEIGDKIEIVTKDNELVSSYVFDDTISYNGVFSEATKWDYSNSDIETESNPTSLGDALKSTFAKVDKANKRIDMVVKDTNDAIANMNLTAGEIKASVEAKISSYDTQIGNIESEMEMISSKAEAAVTAEEVRIQIEQTLNTAVDTITSKTGYSFGNDGLFIDKSDSEMKTQITEDGLAIYRSTDKILKVDNEGVKAEDLHATTYLMIGTHSRLEDYQSNRTGCFWTVKLETEVE